MSRAATALPFPVLPLALALTLALAPPGLALHAPPGALAEAHVHIENFAFNPQTVHVLPGDRVEWDNHDAAPHTVTADDGSFASGTLNQGQSYGRVFGAVGTFPYHCSIHPSMTGTVVVSDPDAAPDLVVAGISFVDLTPGLSKRIDVQVRNLGQGLAGESAVAVDFAYQGQRVPIGSAPVPALGPDAEATVSVVWDTRLKAGDFEVFALADAGQAVEEADEANNEGRAVASVLVSGVQGVDLRDPL